ncbi:MAG: hypothetical protein ACXAC8_00395 [Candidatus Hodarchaeales archaeon]|jgi:hypothetical protein
MVTVENNAKKIESLSKIVRLLGDRLREQNQKIISLQYEITRLSELKDKKQFSSKSKIPQTEKNTDFITSTMPTESSQRSSITTVNTTSITSNHLSSPQLKPIRDSSVKQDLPNLKIGSASDILIEKSSDKKELLQALKIIDNL